MDEHPVQYVFGRKNGRASRPFFLDEKHGRECRPIFVLGRARAPKPGPGPGPSRAREFPRPLQASAAGAAAKPVCHLLAGPASPVQPISHQPPQPASQPAHPACSECWRSDHCWRLEFQHSLRYVPFGDILRTWLSSHIVNLEPIEATGDFEQKSPL